MVQIAMFTHVHIQPCLSPSPLPPVSFSFRTPKLKTAVPGKRKATETEVGRVGAITASASVSGAFDRTVGGQLLPERQEKKTGKKRVFFLDVNPLCYVGSTPSLRAFGRWVSLFFSQVSLSDPVIARREPSKAETNRVLTLSRKLWTRVKHLIHADQIILRLCLRPDAKELFAPQGIRTFKLMGQSHRPRPLPVLDGERGSEHRRQLLPSYKAHRTKFIRQVPASQRYSMGHVGRSHGVITDVLSKCNVPVIKVEGHEADDVVATLAGQILQRGYRVVIGSPDKDFKQLISEDVQIVMPLEDLDRWSFYTLKHYEAQYNCDPCCDLSLRCIIGDEVDGVPGIQHVAPGFGRKTALKLLKKHGSLENLLNAAAVRTVGRQYAQDALTKHADYLRMNHKVLALRRDVDVQLKEEWLVERETYHDSTTLSNFFKLLEETPKLTHQNRSNFSDGLRPHR